MSTDFPRETAAQKEPEIQISVIIPVYNTHRFLSQCLDSFLGQSFRNIEVICIDDGSDDASLDLLYRYARDDARVRVLKQEHKYAGAARNYGLSAAKGEYVWFFDSDDWVEDESLSHIFSKLSEKINNKTDILFFGYYTYDQSTSLKEQQNLPFGGIQNADVLTQRKSILSAAYPVPPWCKVYRREFLTENNLLFGGTKTANDVLFFYTSVFVAKNIQFLFSPIIYWRINSGSSLTDSRKKKNANYEDNFSAYDGILRYIERKSDFECLKYAIAEGILKGIYFGNSRVDKQGDKNFSKTVNTWLSKVSRKSGLNRRGFFGSPKGLMLFCIYKSEFYWLFRIKRGLFNLIISIYDKLKLKGKKI